MHESGAGQNGQLDIVSRVRSATSHDPVGSGSGGVQRPVSGGNVGAGSLGRFGGNQDLSNVPKWHHQGYNNSVGGVSRPFSAQPKMQSELASGAGAGGSSAGAGGSSSSSRPMCGVQPVQQQRVLAPVTRAPSPPAAMRYGQRTNVAQTEKETLTLADVESLEEASR